MLDRHIHIKVHLRVGVEVCVGEAFALLPPPTDILILIEKECVFVCFHGHSG